MADLRWGAGTHPGRIRPQNEDNYFVSDGVFVVADGMGGHEAGEVASHIAVERMREALETTDVLTAQDVVDAITDANGDIFRAAIANPGQAGMGTTVTAIAVIADPLAGRGAPNIDDNDPIDTDPDGNPRITPVVPKVKPEALVLANVGDSRTYLFRHNRLRRVTIDHSYVQELVATGHITDDEARFHPRRNIITRALGIEPDVNVDWWTLPLIRGDRFILCSDGLVDEVTDQEITKVLLENDDPQAVADALIVMANEAGGRDNVTVVVVDVLDGDDPPDPTQEIDIVPAWANQPHSDDTDPMLAPPMVGEPSALADPTPSGIPKPATTDAPDDSNESTDSEPGEKPTGRKARRAAKKQAKKDNKAAKKQAEKSERDADDESATMTGADGETTDDAAPPAKKRRRIGRSIAAFIVIAALIAGSVALAAWARRGYYVDFNNQDEVTVYQGRRGGVLWIDPTQETTGPARDLLADESIELVLDNPTFSARSDAEAFIAGLELADDADASTDPDEPTPSTTDG